MTEPIYDEDAEMAVLGDMLDSASIIPSVLDVLQADDFYLKKHQIVFGAIKEVYEKNKSADPILVGKMIKQAGNVNRIGGLPFLYDLLNIAIDPMNAKYHAEIVNENGNARRLSRGCAEVIKLLQAEGYQTAMTRLSQIMPSVAGKGAVQAIPEMMEEFYENIMNKKAKLDAGEELDEMTTGFYDFDKQTASERGTMLVIGGDPGCGKSSLMRCIAYNRFLQKKKGLLFTTEMKRSAVSACFYSMLAQVSVSGLMRASLDDDGWLSIQRVRKEVDELLGWVDDTGSLTLSHIQSISRDKKHLEGVDFIAVDYVQKCATAGYDSRANALETYAYELDALGKELDLHVILISQLNREERLRLRASGAGYKGSSGIEEAGWCVTSLKTTNVDPVGAERPDLREFITVEVTKDKTAAKSLFPLVFEKPCLRFRDPNQEEREAWEDWIRQRIAR